MRQWLRGASVGAWPGVVALVSPVAREAGYALYLLADATALVLIVAGIVVAFRGNRPFGIGLSGAAAIGLAVAVGWWVWLFSHSSFVLI